jgi:hypothetical protein
MSMCFINFCDPGYSNCDNVTATGCEVNTQFDDNNCGGCNNVCPGVTNCVNGVCM